MTENSSAEMDMHATIEELLENQHATIEKLLNLVSFTQSMPRLYE
jgi:hypothetical protein